MKQKATGVNIYQSQVKNEQQKGADTSEDDGLAAMCSKLTSNYSSAEPEECDQFFSVKDICSMVNATGYNVEEQQVRMAMTGLGFELSFVLNPSIAAGFYYCFKLKKNNI